MKGGARPTVLFYCQHLLGIGHLSRSLSLCRRLCEDFDVEFVQGGPDVGRTLRRPGFRHHFLRPLVMNEGESRLIDPEGKKNAEEIFVERRRSLNQLCEATNF